MQSAALLPDKIFIENKLKINVESGNIYYNNTDTNEGILDFIFN